MTRPATSRTAFFITSYGTGAQLVRLVRTVRTAEPTAEIVVHHDDRWNVLDAAPLEALGVHLLRAEQTIVWGDMTLETARWRVFRWILANLDVDWVMLLSEQDYPIVPLGVLRERLATTDADAVIELERIDRMADPARRREMDRRYRFQYVSLPVTGLAARVPLRWRRRVARVRDLAVGAFARVQDRVFVYSTTPELRQASRVGVRPARSIFSDEFPCWYNNSWCALSRRAVEHVLDHVDRNPDFVRWYEHTVIPVESATATIIANDPTLRTENASLHAIRWSDERSGRPDELGIEDLGWLAESGAVFARKFRGDDDAVFDALDAVVHAVPPRA